jgi:TolA-binding protein
MTLPNKLKATIRISILMSFLMGVSSSFAGDAIQVRAESASHELFERDVDAVALQAQDQSIAKLTGLLGKYRKTSQEPILLEKLAELQQQNAAILFRIAHGNAHRGNKALDLVKYKKEMAQAIGSLTILIDKYPSYSEISHAYFIRGKGYEELENKPAASKDYQYLVANFPLAEETTSAYMSLAEFAIEANEHAKAITYLKEVEKKPDDNHYPFALYKLAWAYYNLKDIPQSLKYAEKQIHFYNDLEKEQAKSGDSHLTTSDEALRENTLLDSAVFYFEGFEETPENYSVAKAFDYFRDLEKGPTIGKMLLRYSKLLRAHDHDQELVEWKNRVLKAELSGDLKSPETLDIVLNTFEHAINRRTFASVTQIAQDIVDLYKLSKKEGKPYASMDRAQKLLSDTADSWQQLIVKNKEAQEAKGLSVHLAALYAAFTQIMDENDPRVPGAHYNLAETLFTIKDYDGATANYRWIVEHGSWRKKDKGTVSVPDASLKAIASRYEILESKGLLPKDVKPVSVGQNDQKALDPLFAEWILWLDTHLQHSTAGTENFYFEANRALYAHGHILDALKRLNTFAEDNPKSDYAIPSASLVLDTYIVTGDWPELLKKTEEYLDMDEWKNLPFHKRLFTASADAAYKMVENQAHLKNYPETLKMADAFLKKYKASERFSDTLVLAGATALESKQPDLAFQYFTRLINEAPKSSALKDALLARASIEESRYELSDASRDYSTYIKLAALPNADKSAPAKDPKKELDQRVALEKKILAYTWINGNWAELKTAIESKEICSNKESEKDNFDGQLVKDCERYQALGMLTHPELFPVDVDVAFDHARKEEGDLAALWAAVSLERSKELAFRDRLLAVRHFAKNWDELDPLSKLTVLPYVNTSIVHTLDLARKMMDQAAPLRVSGNDAEKYITHRVDIMREMENAVTLAMKLPWARIKAESLNELAQTYIDFSTTLAAAQPKGLKDDEIAVYQTTIRKITVPFDEKGQDLRMKAFQLASRYAIEETAMQDISTPFFLDNPSQAKALRKIASVAPAAQKALYSNPYGVSSAIDLDINFLDSVDPAEHWKKAANDHSFRSGENVVENIQHFFIDAVVTKNWAKAAYYLQEAKAKTAFVGPVLSAMKGVVLSTAGAKAEALLEIEDTRNQWVDQRSKLFVLGVLAKHYEQAYSTERADSFNKEIETELTPKVQVTQK